ncbi:MAG: protein-disulfide reductase DsbD [Cyanobacteriota bacterium]
MNLDVTNIGLLVSSNLPLAFFLSFLGGLLASLTPCIFPMLPITIGIIGAKNTKNKLQAFTLSLTYVLGIALTYSFLGVFAALTGNIFGSTLQNPIIVSSIALIFFLMGLSMFDLFYVQVPSSLQTKLNKIYGKQDKTNYLGVAFMGMISGLIATPCVGPVIVALLTYIGQTKNVFLGFWMLFSFAMGMGVLLIILGTFSNLLTNLPKSGEWLNTVKKIMGFSLMLVSFYYIKPLMLDYIFNLLLGIFFIFTGVFSGATDKLDEKSTNTSRFSKSLGITSLTLGLFLFINSLASQNLLGSNFIMNNNTSITNENNKSKLVWLDSETLGLEKAKKESKFIMIDFYADWCASCIELEKFTYTDPKVISELEKLVLVKIDATKENEAISKLFEKYGIVGLPFVLFLDSNGKPIEELTMTGFEKPDIFITRLNKLQDQKKKD